MRSHPVIFSSRTGPSCALGSRSSRQGGVALSGQKGSAPGWRSPGPAGQALCSAPDVKATHPCLAKSSSRFGRSRFLNRLGLRVLDRARRLVLAAEFFRGSTGGQGQCAKAAREPQGTPRHRVGTKTSGSTTEPLVLAALPASAGAQHSSRPDGDITRIENARGRCASENPVRS
jgi:hypothetical protein